MVDKLVGRPFHEALTDINLVSRKDVDIRMIESILLGSYFLPESPRMFPLELLSRFSRAPGANSPVIGRMVAEAAQMVLVTTERCIVPFYPCVSPSSVGVRRRTGYGPTHVLAIATVLLVPRQRKRQQSQREMDEKEEVEEEDVFQVLLHLHFPDLAFSVTPLGPMNRLTLLEKNIYEDCTERGLEIFF